MLRPWLFLFGLIAILASTASANSPPNVIFILTDDLGWGDLGVFHQNASEHPQTHRTPNLDAMAADGLQLRAHYCPAPVCAPSRSSLLTGVHQGNAVVRDNQFDKELEDNETLGTVMRAAGYRTCLIGKYGLQGGPKPKQQIGAPEDWPSYPTKRGFDEFFGYVSHYAGHLHYPNDPWEMANDGHRGTPNLWWSDAEGDREISEQLSKCYTTDLFTAKAKHYIVNHRQHHADQPFFMYLAYDTPHAALQVPTVAYPEGGGEKGGLRWIGESGHMINTATGTVDSFIHPDYADRGWDDLDARFATMVRRIDSCVGDLRQLLVELEIAEDTLIVFTSDNGPHHESYVAGDAWGNGRYNPTAFQSYGPYDGTKRDCWEGGIRMPTLVCQPGTVRTGIDETASQFHDWMATMCDAADVVPPARCDGVSLMPTLTGAGKQAEPTTYIEYSNGGKTQGYEDFLPKHQGRPRKQMQVIRMRGDDGTLFKGVRVNIQSHDDDFEIYDVAKDLSEANDLGRSTQFASLQQRMKDRVLQLRSPNGSAARPYDDAPIPASAETSEEWQVVRSDDIDVPWVPAAFGLTGTAVPGVSSGKPGSVEMTFDRSGLYVVAGGIPADKTGEHQIRCQADTPLFARLHEGHAFDIRSGEGADVAITRTLQAGVHPVRMVVRVMKAPATVTLRWSRDD